MDKSHGQQTQARLIHPLDEILAGIAEGFIAFDNEWRFTYVNAAAERMSGRPASAVLGKPVLDALNIDPTNPFHVAYTTSKASGEPVAFSAYADLVKTWVEVRGYPYPGGYAILFRDIAEERRVHRAAVALTRELEAAHAANRRIFETSLDLILVVDPKGNLLRVSPSSMAILGYAPEDMAGRSATEFLYPEDLENTRNEMRLARRGRVMRNFDCRYLHKDGHIVPLSWTGVWSEPERQHYFIGRDMTERVAAEERQRRSQRLEAVGQLTGGIAHDFNNLLSVVIGNLELLDDCVKADADAAPLAAKALEAALRGAELTHRLLAFARRQPLDAKVVALNERVSATMDLLRRTLGEQIKIATALAPELWPTMIDPAQFESALVNLAINARDAMRGAKDGGCSVHRDREPASRRGLCPAQHRRRAGRLRHGRRHGHRRRHVAGRGGARLRAVLHDQAARRGHRARAQHGLRLHPPVPGPHQDLQRARDRHDRPALSAARRPRRRDEPRSRRRRRARKAASASASSWSRTMPMFAGSSSPSSTASATPPSRRTTPKRRWRF